MKEKTREKFSNVNIFHPQKNFIKASGGILLGNLYLYTEKNIKYSKFELEKSLEYWKCLLCKEGQTLEDAK